MAKEGLALWITVGATMLAAGLQAYAAGKMAKKKKAKKEEEARAAAESAGRADDESQK